jgi:superfamily II DNA/RNA helicase
MLPKGKNLQIILFSATFPDHVRNYASKIAPNANKIELKKEELSVDNIKQFYMDCRNEEHKYDILVSLYHMLTIGQSIIFCQVSFLYARVVFDESRGLCMYVFENSTAIPQTGSRSA